MEGSISAYRLDKILLALPDWVMDCELNDFTLAFKFPKKLDKDLRREIADLAAACFLAGPVKALSAGCALLALLEKEGLGKEKNARTN